ncbi:hypothetical protein [Nocardioides sp. zg-1228]|uniref:Vgb family protein n=1 Tax=Nocardioides sp. zg-1228 TaxID=2763008 RepID=UPI0016432474|nr:hypothetical protein [Nocardioides sp. zg-1228]MBC2932476.1 hypothetical protein [Nocardioides sp. zg-1228]QSF57983.1 hypothetical protein JX575_01755 [Nocardioides sp. zg-1228]
MATTSRTSRTSRTSLLAALTLLLGPLLLVQAPAPASAAASVFPVPTSNAGLGRITTAPDGTMWFVMRDANKVGRITPGGAITEFPLGPTTVAGARVMDLDVSPDGSVWVVHDQGWKATRLDPATGGLDVYDLGGEPYGGAVRVGPDNAAWITMNYDESGIVRAVPGQPVTWAANAPECKDLLGEATDGAMWCQGAGLNTLVKVGPDANSGVTYPLPSDTTYPMGLAGGPVGSIWFTRSTTPGLANPADGSVGYIDQASGATQIWRTGSRSAPHDIVRGPDDQMWFTNRGAAPGIGHISATGVGAISSVGNYQPTSLTFGPDGAIWFTDETSNAIVRVTTDELQTTDVDLGDGVTMIPPTSPTAARPVGRLPKAKGVTKVRRGKVAVRVACPARAAGGCAGRVGLELAKGGTAIAPRKAYRIEAGRTKTVAVRLSRKGMRSLRAGLVVMVRVELTAPGSRKVQASRTIKVRRG